MTRMVTRLLTRALRPILVPLMVIEERDRAQAKQFADAINSTANGAIYSDYKYGRL